MSSAPHSSHATTSSATLPQDAVKLKAAAAQLEVTARAMEVYKTASQQLSVTAGDIATAVCASCANLSLVDLPVFAQPVVDIAANLFAQCAADMKTYQKKSYVSRLTKWRNAKVSLGDCLKACEALRDLLQIQNGCSLLVESKAVLTFPQPSARKRDTSELGKRISLTVTLFDGIKVLLGGTVNATDGVAVHNMGPIPIKAMAQTVLQMVNHYESFNASKDNLERLQSTIESLSDVICKNYAPDVHVGATLNEQVRKLVRLLLRTVIRLYLVRAAPSLKRFIAVATISQIIADEKRALDEAKGELNLALGFSTNAGVSEISSKMATGSKVDDLAGHVKAVADRVNIEGDRLGVVAAEVGDLKNVAVVGVAAQVNGLDAHIKAVSDCIRADGQILGVVAANTAHLKEVADTRDLRQWLGVDPAFEGRQRQLLKRCVGEPRWFLKGKSFLAWNSGEAGVYWVSSSPGCGKSVLLSAIIDHLQPEERVFFHFDMRNQAQQPKLRDFLAALVYQLGNRLHAYPSELLLAHERGLEMQASEEVLRDAAIAMLNSRPWIVAIDALDECPEVRQQWETVVPLFERLRGTKARIIVTSRNENNDLVQFMRKFATHRLHLNNSVHHQKAINRFIYAQLYTPGKFPVWSNQQKNNVATLLKQKSGGMFLWVSLQIDQMRKALPRSVDKMLNEVPVTIHDTYRMILEGFTDSKFVANPAAHVLQCVALSPRSMSPHEVSELLLSFAFPPLETSPQTNPPFQRLLLPHESLPDIMPDPEVLILSYLPAFLQITDDAEHGKVVRFNHLSAVEYLQSEDCRKKSDKSLVPLYAFNDGMAHTTWLRICLTIFERKMSLKLTDGAKSQWVRHIIGRMEDRLNGAEFLTRYLTPAPPSLTELFVFRSKRGSTPFHRACASGPLHLVEWFLAQYKLNAGPVWPQLPGPSHNNAMARYIHAATRPKERRHPLIDLTDVHGGTPLCEAAFAGKADVCSFLLAKGSNIRAYGGLQDRTALHLAVWQKHYDTARVLIISGAPLDATDLNLDTPLHYAARNGCEEIIELLLEHGAALEANNHLHFTPLFDSVFSGHLASCSLLLTRGSNVMHRLNDGSTALHAAARRGHVEIARILLAHGASIAARADSGCTPLELAVKEEQDEMVAFLSSWEAAATSTADVQDKCHTQMSAVADAGEI